MSTIIKSTEFKPEMITYSEPKQLNGGRGKTVYISYGEYGHYSLQTPVMKLPFGLSIDDRQEVPKYALDLSFRGIETDPKLEKFYNSLDKMDNKLVDDAVKHSMEWFKKKKSSKEVMSNLYNPIIRLSKDKETGEPDGKYPATFKVKIPTYDNKFGCDIFDDKKQQLKLSSEELKDYLSKGSKIQALIKCTGVYFAAGKFGVSWRASQLKVFRNNIMKGYAFLDDSDDEDIEEVDETTKHTKKNVEKELDNQIDDSEDENSDDDTI